MIESKSVKKNLTSTSEVRLEVDGLSTAVIELTGTFTATLAFEYTINGEDWYALTATVIGSTSTATSATAAGKWTATVAGYQQIRVRCSAFTNGTIEAALRAVLSGGTSSGIGLEYNATPPTLSDGGTDSLQGDVNGNLKVTQATGLSKTTDSVEARPEGATYSNIAASTLVRTGAGILVGMYVNSTTSGTIKFWDQTSAASPVINNTITPAVGYHPLGNAKFTTGLYATIANTLDVTLYYIPVS